MNEITKIMSGYQVYIDTSALMNVEQLKVFIDNVEKDFTFRKKINILSNVYQELTDFSNGYDNDKKNYAKEALKLISKSFIFAVNPEFKRKKNPFADPRILTTLIENKIHTPQMLITFDKKLSIDAYNLNDLKCMENQNDIKVMAIDSEGMLYVPECIELNIKEISQTETITVENKETIIEGDVIMENNSKTEEVKESKITFSNKKKDIKKPFYKRFDFWAGNVTGGLIASGLIFVGKKIIKSLI